MVASGLPRALKSTDLVGNARVSGAGEGDAHAARATERHLEPLSSRVAHAPLFLAGVAAQLGERRRLREAEVVRQRVGAHLDAPHDAAFAHPDPPARLLCTRIARDRDVLRAP